MELVLAAIRNIDAVRTLLEENEYSMAQKAQAMGAAADYQRLDVLSYIAENHMGPEIEALYHAVKDGDLETTESLLESREYDPNVLRTLPLLAASGGNVEVVRYLSSLGHFTNYSPDQGLLRAADEGDIEGMKYFIAQGGNIHAYNDQIFLRAAVNGKINVVLYLLSIQGYTPYLINNTFSIAVGNGHLELVKILLEILEPSPVVRGINMAAEKNHFLMLRYLVSKGFGPYITRSVTLDAKNEETTDFLADMIDEFEPGIILIPEEIAVAIRTNDDSLFQALSSYVKKDLANAITNYY